MSIKKFFTYLGWPLLVLPLLASSLGYASNEAACLKNGGAMPVYGSAYTNDAAYKEFVIQHDLAKGGVPKEPDYIHQAADEKTKLHYLCDIFPSDGGIESVGDIVIGFGDEIQTPLFAVWFLGALYCWKEKKGFYLS